jgi:flagellar biosynthesis chaperone FliJ
MSSVDDTVKNYTNYLQMIDKYVSEKDAEWNKTNKKVVTENKQTKLNNLIQDLLKK